MSEFVEENKQEQEIILFAPKNGEALKRTYKDLRENPKFKDLANEDLLFVWLFACKGGPINQELPDDIKALAAVSEAKIKDPDKRSKFQALQFSEKMKDAIEEMKLYNPRAREIAMQITQNNYNNLLKISKIDVNQFKYKNDQGNESIDTAAMKQYIDAIGKTSDILPSLLAQVEHGFGITDKKGKEIPVEKAINKFHQQRKDNE